jgi:hypothetical protein
LLVVNDGSASPGPGGWRATAKEVRSMKRTPWYPSLAGSVVIALVLGGAAILSAQTTDPKVPASSPLWWTLTDELSPQELRRIYADPADSRRRYLLAVERHLMEQWEIDPAASVAERMLPALKRELGSSDWALLRAYLLEEVSPLSSAIELED